MKILVIDDSPVHQESARQTLEGHELTIATTYDQAHGYLKVPMASWSAVKEELERRGHPYPGTDSTDEEWAAYHVKQRKVEVELCPPPSFEVVLCDLLMPASRMTMGEKGLRYVGQEMPVGFALALMAVLHGAKYVAVVTDTNHHDHPASAMMDAIHSDTYNGAPRFVMNGVKVAYYHTPEMFVDGTTCPACNGSGAREVCYCIERNGGQVKPGCETCKGAGRYCWDCRNSGKRWGKDWGRVLQNVCQTS